MLMISLYLSRTQSEGTRKELEVFGSSRNVEEGCRVKETMPSSTYNKAREHVPQKNPTHDDHLMLPSKNTVISMPTSLRPNQLSEKNRKIWFSYLKFVYLEKMEVGGNVDCGMFVFIIHSFNNQEKMEK